MLPRPLPSLIPELTIRIAQAAFPKGNTFILMRDTLGTIFTDLDFAELFPKRGQPALSLLATGSGHDNAIRRRTF